MMKRQTLIRNLKSDISELTRHGRRDAGSGGHWEARKYLIERIKGLGLIPYMDSSYELPYEKNEECFVNVAAKLKAEITLHNPILLGGHYDTCGTQPGASDNASGLSIILAIIEILKTMNLKRDIIILFFDAEEPPYWLTPSMGSTNFYLTQRKEDIDCALIVDMLGHDTPVSGYEDLIFMTGMESHSELERIIQKYQSNKWIRFIPVLNKYIGDMSDHHIFRLNGIPYLFISGDEFEYYHSPQDTIEKLNFKKMSQCIELILALVVECCNAQFNSGIFNCDTTKTEISFINKILSSFLCENKLNPVNSREDIDNLVKFFHKKYNMMSPPEV